VAVVDRSFQRIHDTFTEVGGQARAEGRPLLMAMAEAYTALHRDPGLLPCLT
jgi:hypothetical protein